MSSSVILVTGYDPSYLAIFEHLVRSEAAIGNHPIIFDITPALATTVDSYHRGVLGIFGLDYPGHDIASRIAAAGGEYVRYDPSLPMVSAAMPLATENETALEIAVQSALITFFRTDRPNGKSKLVSKMSSALSAEGRTVFRAVEQFCRERQGLVTAYVPNGRFPSQKLATLAFKHCSVSTIHIEKGEAPGRAYVQPYAPQDRIRSQESVATVLEGRSTASISQISSDWLARRAPSKTSPNEFSSLWTDGLPAEIVSLRESGSKIAGFYTSSQDEFQFLGPEWQLHSWVDQFEAFDLLLTRFEEAGYACYLRVHPNLATKAHDCFRRERDGIRDLARRHPRLVVIWHDDPSSTYELLGISDAVVVWDSTVGLEASARGLPVWTTATSRYGLVADIREVLSSSDLDRLGVEPWDVDSHRAEKFIAYLVERDEDVRSSEPWVPWSQTKMPLGAKFAAIAVSGGAPRADEAILSLLDVYRHRGLAANLKALRLRNKR